jgi:hypothetical protein
MAGKERSAEIAAEIMEEAERLVRLEIALAKQEAAEFLFSNLWAAGGFAVAGIFAFLAILIVLPVLIVVAVPVPWLAALIWFLLYAAVAAAGYLVGRLRLRTALPQRTITSLKETRDWALRQMRSPGR